MQKQENHSQAAIPELAAPIDLYSGSILVPIMIARALGYNAQQLTHLISRYLYVLEFSHLLAITQLNK